MICFVSTVSWPLKVYLEPHLEGVKNNTTSKIYLIANDIDEYGKDNFDMSFLRKKIPIKRKINILFDLISVFYLYVFLKRNNITSVHSIMPKAGLVSTLASFMARVPLRIHTFTGQVWVTKKGFSRYILKQIDKYIANLATHILCDSHLQMEFLISNGIVKRNKIKVLANGSISGINANRFSPNPIFRGKIRCMLAINSSEIVFLYLGRLNKDKGIFDLINAFLLAFNTLKNPHLIIVGPDEENVDQYIKHLNHFGKKNIHRFGFSNTPEQFMASCDVFCLPSYREGFNNSVLESGSVGIPVLASDIIGISDAVINGVTGLLHLPADVNGIYSGMIKLAKDSDLRFRLGNAARDRILSHFSQELVTKEFLKFYDSIGVFNIYKI